MILRLAASVEHRLVTDRRTDRRTDTRRQLIPALSSVARVKTVACRDTPNRTHDLLLFNTNWAAVMAGKVYQPVGGGARIEQLPDIQEHPVVLHNLSTHEKLISQRPQRFNRSKTGHSELVTTRMWADAQRDGRPAKCTGLRRI